MTYLIHELFSYFLSIFQPILSRVRRNCSLKQFPMFPFYLFFSPFHVSGRNDSILVRQGPDSVNRFFFLSLHSWINFIVPFISRKKHVCTVTRRLSVATEGATYKRLLFQFRCNCDNGTLVFMKIRS